MSHESPDQTHVAEAIEQQRQASNRRHRDGQIAGPAVRSAVGVGKVSSPPAADGGSAFSNVGFPFAKPVTAECSLGTCPERV